MKVAAASGEPQAIRQKGTVSTLAITLSILAALIIAMSLYGFVSPPRILAIARRFMVSPGIWAAAGIRLLLAVLFWFSDPVSLTPVAFRLFAILALAASVAIPIIGTQRLLELADRLESWPNIVVRVQGIVGIAFGAFILWSMWQAVSA